MCVCVLPVLVQVTHAESLCELVLGTPDLEGKTVNAVDAFLRRRKKDAAAAGADPNRVSKATAARYVIR